MNTPKRWRGLAALLLAVAMVAAACGGRDDESSDSTSGGSDGGGGDGGDDVALIADPADCDTYEGTQGVTDDKILIGNSLPQSGIFAVFDKVRVGIEAYFTFANSEGGIEGRDLELVSKDDQYLPERTRANIEELVNNEGVFAFVGNVGTENNQQAQQALEEAGLCVPNLAVATGFPGFGDPDKDPWIINGLPNYALESIAFADYLKENKPDAKVAILSQNDSFGESYVEGFKQAIEGTDLTLVAEETFDPKTQTDPGGQVTTLAASGADALLLGVTSLPCPNALGAIKTSGWDPITYVTLTCSSKVLMDIAGDSSEGTLSTQATLDPAGADNQSAEGVAEFKEQGATAGLTEEDLNDNNVAAGWGFGAYLVQLLKASPELDRATVMNTAWAQKDVRYGLMIDGIDWTTDGATDPFGYNQLQYVNRTNGAWVPEGDPVDYTDQLTEQLGN